jgi:hypothetical protein
MLQRFRVGAVLLVGVAFFGWCSALSDAALWGGAALQRCDNNLLSIAPSAPAPARSLGEKGWPLTTAYSR